MKKVLILTILALIAAGCGKPEEARNAAPVNAASPASNTAANTQPAVEPVKEETYTKGADPRADLISATQKLQKMPFWSAVVTSASNLDLKIEMQYAAPDRYRIKNAEGEVVVIGSEAYSNETGQWEKVDDDIGAFIRQQTTSGIAEGVKTLKDVQIAGKEKFAGKDTTVYTHKAGEAVVKVWIDTESGLQVKNEVEMNVGGEMQRQTTVYDYVTPVKIEAPKIN